MAVFTKCVRHMKGRALAIAIGCALASAGFANAAETGSRAAGDVQVLSGGVGEGERKELAAHARGYNLKLVFTLATGNFLAEIPFQIKRGGKTIAEETATGPWAFVKVPPGTYTVSAAHEGRTQTKQVSAPRSGQKRVAFVWPASPRLQQQPN